ncbi:MAG: hypothetical protein JW786_01020 [Desulfobacterales bacterium]|nr:hypothetical protein [Desulfobacterales bacterium]
MKTHNFSTHTSQAVDPMPAELRELLEMQPKTPHLLRLLRLSPQNITKLKASQRPINFWIFGGVQETYDPKDYTEEDYLWAENVMNLAVKAREIAKSERYAEAIPIQMEAIRMAPGHDLLMLNLAVSYAKLNQIPITIKILEKAKQLYPDSKKVLLTLEAYKISVGK